MPRESIKIANTSHGVELHNAVTAHQMEMDSAAQRFEPLKNLLETFSKDLKKRMSPHWDAIEKYLRDNDLMPEKYDTGNYVLRVEADGDIYLETKTPEQNKMKRLLESLS